MKYTEEMILHSDSGYCMPFEEPRGKDVELSLGYGEQVHPTTGEKFFHHGIDFKARCYMLSAVASGIVSGVGNDPVHGICQTVRYGGYEVTYGHLSNVFAQFGQRVEAGQTVALSGERLHIEVKFKGEELNPIEFLTMLYGNIKALQETDGNGPAGFYDTETGVTNDYEKDQREIEELMLRFLPLYMEDLQRGSVHGARTYGTVATPHLHDGSDERVFLRADAEHSQSPRTGAQSHAACQQSSEPTDSGFPELPCPAA